MEEEINMLDEIKEIRLIEEDDDETFDLWLPVKMEEEINMLDEIKEIRLIEEDDDETFDLWLPGKVEDLIKCLLEENDFVVEDNDVTTFDLRSNHIMQTTKEILNITYQSRLDKAKHNLDNAKQQMELMVEENKSLKATIENKNKHILETENNVSNSETEKIVSQRTITKLQTNIRNLLKELNDLKKRFSSVTDKLRGAEQKVIELTKNIDDQTQDKETASAKLDKLEKENEYLVNQLRSNENKMELLNNSHETERKKHESAMKWIHARCSENEIELEKHKNANFNLLLQLDRVHNYSRISMEDTALFDKTFIEQKLEDERAKEEDLAEVTTNVITKFASAKDRRRVIKSFQKRIEKGSCPSPFRNDFLSDEDSHMEGFPTAIHEYRDNKQYNERLEESKTTKNCHNKTEKNTNVFNISMNIAKSNVSFIDKKEERTLRLNGGNSDHKAIEGKDQL